jgi:hypothetical protein
MTTPKRPPLPVFLNANNLLEGDVVFWGKSSRGEHWVRDHRLAIVANTTEEADRLDAMGQAELQNNTVVDVYLVDVVLDEQGIAQPKHYRERIKTLGPSIHPQWGKQADYGFAPYRAASNKAKG